jgi:hypothetical protein
MKSKIAKLVEVLIILGVISAIITLSHSVVAYMLLSE